MGATDKSFRQSVTLPKRVAQRVKSLAKAQRTSANRVIVDLIESGIEAKEREKQQFFTLTAQLTESKDVAERERLKKELARMTFGS
jgi:metal-responsive CopG/Arc/MetJ family transcriptional regulator